jgi:hypothetical protein
VLALLADGVRNAEIATRLLLSEPTVDHDVAAILRELDVHLRGEAGAAAVRGGLAGRSRRQAAHPPARVAVGQSVRALAPGRAGPARGRGPQPSHPLIIAWRLASVRFVTPSFR